MADRGRYDAAMFWLAFGTAAAVIGLALMTIGVARLPAGANVFTSYWFDAGLGLLAIGVLLLLWALGLYLARRGRSDARLAQPSRGKGEHGEAAGDMLSEAVRGYYAERERLMKIWERDRKRRPKSRD